MTKKSIFTAFLVVLGISTAYSQVGFPNIAIGGGPSAGVYLNNTDELNNQLKLAGFSEFPKAFFTLGGGGFIDFEVSKRRSNEFIRFGGLGLGFSAHTENTVDTITKAATLNYGMGGMSIEYIRTFGSVFDITGGVLLTTGSYKLDLYQYTKSYGNFNGIWGEFGSSSSSQNITRNFKSRFYAVQPVIGIGVLVKKAIYFRLQAGYNFAALGKWKTDNDVEVSNFPSDIKANGFNISLGLNFGIFFRED